MVGKLYRDGKEIGMNYIAEFNKYVKDISDKHKELFQQLSQVDCEQDDLLHFLELEACDAVTMMKVIKKLKEVRNRRREIKNDLAMIQKVHCRLGKPNLVYTAPNTYAVKTDVLQGISDKTKIVTKVPVMEE